MIAIDTSAFSQFLDGEDNRSTTLVRSSLRAGTAVIAGVVVTEVLSHTLMWAERQATVLSVPVLAEQEGFWLRAASLRRDVLAQGKRANIADVLIAQTCIDYDIPLITYDRDYRHFLPAGLRLA